MATAVPQQPYASIRRRVLSYCAEVILLFTGVLLLQGILFALRLNPLVRGLQSGAALSKGSIICGCWGRSTCRWLSTTRGRWRRLHKLR